MRKTILFIIGLIWGSFNVFSQDYQKISFDSSDSTKYYYQVVPDVQPTGLLILLPGARGNSEWPLKTTKIPYIAADSGLVTIMINYEIWLCWLRDDILDLLNKSILDVISKHNIPGDRCVIGGFSSGGNMALNYAILSFLESTQTVISPKGVFGLDPPVDLIELYNVLNIEMQGFMTNGKKVKVSDETKYMHKNMTTFLGTPVENKKNYVENSAFIFSDRYNSGGQAIYLKDLHVRIYSSIDKNYLQSKANGSFYFDCSPYLVSFLKHNGNENATFKSQYDIGYYPDGGEKFRGRHAWKGYDSKECVDWILEIIKNQ